MVFYLTEVSAAILVVIFLLELAARRFWCRWLCPAGALFGLFAPPLPGETPSRPRLQGVRPVRRAVPHGRPGPGRGTLSPRLYAVHGMRRPLPEGHRPVWHQAEGEEPAAAGRSFAPRRVDGHRGGGGDPGAAVAVRLGHESPVPPHLIRPPGAGDEKTFLSLCIRCGECMKVCPTNVLQPAIFEAGLAGMFSPRLVPRLLFEQSNCEYTCTLCSQVCPTGAIPRSLRS